MSVIIPVTPDEYEQHHRGFQRAVCAMFPMLCIPPEWMQAFLEYFSQIGDDQTVFQTQTQSGAAFGRRTHWEIHYLIPSDWNRRHEIVSEALREIQAEFFRSNAPALTIAINEIFPSHNFYFSGLAAALGFEMQYGEIILQAGADLLTRIAPPALPPDVREVRVEDSRLPEYAALYAQAHAGSKRDRSAILREQRWPEIIADAAEYEDLRSAWIGLERHGQVIASCYGGCRPERWGEIMSVEELAVLPQFSGRGLGRYVLIRCLQELQRRYGAPGRVFQIGTWRHLGLRPINLYLGLGFRATEVKTRAVLWNKSTDFETLRN